MILIEVKDGIVSHVMCDVPQNVAIIDRDVKDPEDILSQYRITRTPMIVLSGEIEKAKRLSNQYKSKKK